MLEKIDYEFSLLIFIQIFIFKINLLWNILSYEKNHEKKILGEPFNVTHHDIYLPTKFELEIHLVHREIKK